MATHERSHFGGSARGAVPVGSEHELFVDERMISSAEGIRRTLHQLRKHPENPILVADRPWEGTAVFIYGSVIRDPEDGIWKMWYRSGTGGREDYERMTNVCYATSVDGIHWSKPALGLHEHYGYNRTNIVLKAHTLAGVAQARLDSVAVFKDPCDPDPARRYKMVTWQYNDMHYFAVDKPRPSGCYAAFSPDGLRWREETERPFFLVGNGLGDTLNLMHDTRRRKYVIFIKIFVTTDGRFIHRDEQARQFVRSRRGNRLVAPNRPFPLIRRRGQAESEDFLNWTEPTWILRTDRDDPPDVQFYNNTGFIYGSQYLGLLHVYHPETTGTIDVQLISSRDGKHWERCFDRRPILPCGQADGEWDFGCHSTSSEPPQRVGDELWFYYSSGWRRHAGCGPKVPTRDGNAGRAIGLATLRLDGFVSVDAGRRGGVLTTVPVALQHPGIWINAAIRRKLAVEVLSAEGKPLEGLSGQAAGIATGDSVQMPVIFQYQAALGRIAGRPVRLRFIMQDASLYAFWSGPSLK